MIESNFPWCKSYFDSPPMTEQNTLTRQHETKTIGELVLLYQNSMLDLSPTFQRKSVWTSRDRQHLIDTILRNYPLPALFFYKNETNGKISYSVIDGKQRLETILGFLGEIRGMAFDVTLEIQGLEGPQKISARSLKQKREHRERLLASLMGYRIPVIEVAGSLSDIIEVFVRINSTGKPLSPQEKRKAKYSGSTLLVEATQVAEKIANYLLTLGAISKQQQARMKHVEFAAELLVTMEEGDVINKKSAVDKVMARNAMTSVQLKKASGRVIAAINNVKRIFPDLNTTRFKQIGDFYTLVVLFDKLAQENAVLSDKKRNKLAADLLRNFASEVDKLGEIRRKVQGASPGQEIYRDYLATVLHGTDAIGQRKRREEILRNVIGSVFSQKDSRRGFTPEQRRILWNTTSEKKCAHPGCRTKLTWDNFTIDHIDPYSMGGRAELDNAALMCKQHNSSKGNGTRTVC